MGCRENCPLLLVADGDDGMAPALVLALDSTGQKHQRVVHYLVVNAALRAVIIPGGETVAVQVEEEA